MPTRLNVTIFAPDGLDLSAQFDGLVDYTFVADNGSTAFFWADFGECRFSISYVEKNGTVFVTGFTFFEAGNVVLTARFDEPVPTSYYPYELVNLMDEILADTQFQVGGSPGDDVAEGGDFDDRMRMGDGNDIAEGGKGNDVLLGGQGRDYLSGGAKADQLGGGADHDLIDTGQGNDTAFGGDGNDVILMYGGDDRARGGAGADIFVVQGFGPTAGGSPNIQTAVIQDFEPDDVLILGGAQGISLPGSLTFQTLADIENGTVDDFQWRDTARGVEMQVGEAQILLAGITADMVDLDRLYFSADDAGDTADLLLGDGTFASLGTGFNGDVTLTYGGAQNAVILSDGEVFNIIAADNSLTF